MRSEHGDGREIGEGPEAGVEIDGERAAYPQHSLTRPGSTRRAPWSAVASPSPA